MDRRAANFASQATECAHNEVEFKPAARTRSNSWKHSASAKPWQASFSSPPTGSSGLVFFSGPLQLRIGRVAADNFTYKGVPLLSLAADFGGWERTMLRDVKVRHES